MTSLRCLTIPGQIDPRFSYAVQARITVDGDLQFVTTGRFPVITNGNPTEVEVRVEPVDQMAADETQLTGIVWQRSADSVQRWQAASASLP
ncbi:MAG: YbaY family lipoprotein [Phormidesmis sp.]